MKVTVQINVGTTKGRQIIDYLKSFPDVVIFEDTILNEPQQDYMTKPTTTLASSENYVTAEDFRVEAKKRAKIFLKNHSLHS